MGRLSEVYQGVRDDAGDCWAALCGFHFIHMFDRPRHYNGSGRGNGSDGVVVKEGAGLDGQGPEWQPLVTVQPRPESQPESSRLLQDLQMQNQRNRLMRARMVHEIEEDESLYHFTRMEPDTQVRIDQGEQLERERKECARKARNALGVRLYRLERSRLARDRSYSPESSGSHASDEVLQTNQMDILATDKTLKTDPTDVVSAGALQYDQVNLVRAVTGSSAVVYVSGSKEKLEKIRKHSRKRAASLPLDDSTR